MTDTISNSAPPQTASANAWNVAAWAIYLAMSWTWCIGMFLPVILMRELGLPGVICFAIPNILGAAAMGWVIHSPDQSRKLIQNNRPAFILFSQITIAFHAFFAAWIIRKIAGPIAGPEIVAVFLAFWLILKWRPGGQFLSVTLALLISAALISWAFWRKDLPYIAHPVEGTRLPPIDNLFLAPAWLLGFICCPYLDLTFHTARQALPRTQSRFAFTLGFCALFPMVLLLTVAYSGWLTIGFDRLKYPQLAFILATYLIIQSCLTCALHAQQISLTQTKSSPKQFLAFSALLIASTILGLWDYGDLKYNNIAPPEIIYRLFLGFYGLVAPAYVWLRLLPPRRSTLRVCTVIAIAAPLFWMGFAAEQTPFIVPGVIIVLLAKFLPDMQSAE